MLVLEAIVRLHAEEDEMHPEMTRQLAAQHIAELHQEAARRHLIRDLRTGPGPARSRRHALWDRLLLRQPRPTAA